MRGVIFDDEEQVLKCLSSLLTRSGYAVSTYPNSDRFCTNGADCDTNEMCADFLISDVNMDPENGLEFVERLHARGCHIQNMALISGHWPSDALKRAEDLGCKIFHKPILLEEMKAWLHECCEHLNPDRILVDIPWGESDGSQV